MENAIFPEKRFHHYRNLGTAERGVLAALFSYGEKDYYLGDSPMWEIFRLAYSIHKKTGCHRRPGAAVWLFLGSTATYQEACVR